MGLLKGSSVYLIGAVDHADDPRKWRREIARDLLLPMGVRVYDPLVKPSWLNDDTIVGSSCGPQTPPTSFGGIDPSEDFKIFKSFLKTPETFNELEVKAIKFRMDYIRKLCLRMASNCDFIIGSLPKRFTVGTLEELQIATRTGKPVLFHLPDGMDTSTWLPAQIDSFFENSFTTMEELYDRLRSIDSGDAKVDNLEWIFLSYFNDEDVINEFADCQQVGNQST